MRDALFWTLAVASTVSGGRVLRAEPMVRAASWLRASFLAWGDGIVQRNAGSLGAFLIPV